MEPAWRKRCSVPGCRRRRSNKQPPLVFHPFPADGGVRHRWIRALGRDEDPDFTATRGATYVCSNHFTLDDYVVGTSSPFTVTTRRLKPEAVPSLFPWSHLVPEGNGDPGDERDLNRNPEQSAGDQMERTAKTAWEWDHDYATPPPAGVLDQTADYIRDLEVKLKIASLPPDLFSRYCASDDQMRFYTRFPSERVFKIFWDSIAPSASHLVYWNKAWMRSEGPGVICPSPTRTLPLIDEFLIYCMQVAVGMRGEVLADMFQVGLPTVRRVTITWANYLFFVLGTLPLWLSRKMVKSARPGKFKKHCPKVRVILDCTEISVAATSSMTVRSKTSDRYKNGTTLKGLIGVAPHGSVTFFSPLYTGSISDREMTKIGGILPLLESGDEVMAAEDAFIEDLLSGVGAELVVPPFNQLAKDDKKTKALALLRRVGDRVIGRIKSNHIWDSPVPLSLVGIVGQMWHNCCVMVNFQEPLSLEEN